MTWYWLGMTHHGYWRERANHGTSTPSMPTTWQPWKRAQSMDLPFFLLGTGLRTRAFLSGWYRKPAMYKRMWPMETTQRVARPSSGQEDAFSSGRSRMEWWEMAQSGNGLLECGTTQHVCGIWGLLQKSTGGIRYVSTRDVVKHDPVSSSMILSDQKGGVVDLDSSQLPSRRGF